MVLALLFDKLLRDHISAAEEEACVSTIPVSCRERAERERAREAGGAPAESEPVMYGLRCLQTRDAADAPVHQR